MWIYKITNIQNKKVYIGQTIRPIEKRFQRHLNGALNCKLDTHFARAIRKYGAGGFIIEEIDKANSQDELNQKEQYWIRYYNSIKNGYNETDAIYKCGGNTYQSKTSEELKEIGKKISKTKIEGLNPNARHIKLINVETNEEVIFDSIIGCARYLGIKSGKTSITERLSGKRTSLYKKKYKFEYCNNKCVSTIPGECKGVGSEISTDPKQETID